MTTQQAIDQLTTLSENLGAQATKALTDKAAVDTAIAQLKGLLDTPSADLTAKDVTITERDRTIDALKAMLTEKQELIDALTSELEAVQPDQINQTAEEMSHQDSGAPEIAEEHVTSTPQTP